MVDPALTQQANNDAVRPPPSPIPARCRRRRRRSPGRAAATTGAATSETLKSAPAPVSGGACTQCTAARESLTLGALAARQKDGRTSSCAGNLRYSARWAERLPADLPLYPDARVKEAAGTRPAVARSAP